MVWEFTSAFAKRLIVRTWYVRSNGRAWTITKIWKIHSIPSGRLQLPPQINRSGARPKNRTQSRDPGWLPYEILLHQGLNPCGGWSQRTGYQDYSHISVLFWIPEHRISPFARQKIVAVDLEYSPLRFIGLRNFHPDFDQKWYLDIGP